MSNGQDAAASSLERARASDDELEQRLWLAAAVQAAALAVGARMVVTGGTAADFYASGTLGTSGAYPAKRRPRADIDVVVIHIEPWKEARVPLLRQLEALGMRPRYVAPDVARIVDVPGVPFALEIVGDESSRDPKGERVVTVLLDGIVPLTMRGPEDVILAYGESGWQFWHAGDWTRALAVYAAMKDRLDHARLEDEARRRGQSDVLVRIERIEPLPKRRSP